MTITDTHAGSPDGTVTRDPRVPRVLSFDDGSTDDMWLEVQRRKEQDNYIPARHRWKFG